MHKKENNPCINVFFGVKEDNLEVPMLDLIKNKNKFSLSCLNLIWLHMNYRDLNNSFLKAFILFSFLLFSNPTAVVLDFIS